MKQALPRHHWGRRAAGLFCLALRPNDSFHRPAMSGLSAPARQDGPFRIPVRPVLHSQTSRLAFPSGLSHAARRSFMPPLAPSFALPGHRGLCMSAPSVQRGGVAHTAGVALPVFRPPCLPLGVGGVDCVAAVLAWQPIMLLLNVFRYARKLG